jgi:hypothetical protein
MSNIKADNFTWKTGEATGQSGTTVTGPQVVYGVAKSWINFNGVSSFSTRASFNISSGTRNGSGDYSVSFSTSFVDSNYSIASSTNYQSSTTRGGNYIMTYYEAVNTGFPPTSSTYRCYSGFGAASGANGGQADMFYNSLTFDR